MSHAQAFFNALSSRVIAIQLYLKRFLFKTTPKKGKGGFLLGGQRGKDATGLQPSLATPRQGLETPASPRCSTRGPLTMPHIFSRNMGHQEPMLPSVEDSYACPILLPYPSTLQPCEVPLDFSTLSQHFNHFHLAVPFNALRNKYKTAKREGVAIDASGERELLIKAVRVNTLSKLTYGDTRQFLALIGDVFPGAESSDIPGVS